MIAACPDYIAPEAVPFVIAGLLIAYWLIPSKYKA